MAALTPPSPTRDAWLVPPAPFTADLLADAVRAAVPRTRAPAPTAAADGAAAVSWGDQLHVRVLPAVPDGQEASGVAGYLAKYATKSSDARAELDHRLRDISQLADLGLDDHLRRS